MNKNMSTALLAWGQKAVCQCCGSRFDRMISLSRVEGGEQGTSRVCGISDDVFDLLVQSASVDVFEGAQSGLDTSPWRLHHPQQVHLCSAAGELHCAALRQDGFNGRPAKIDQQGARERSRF